MNINIKNIENYKNLNDYLLNENKVIFGIMIKNKNDNNNNKIECEEYEFYEK